MHILYAKIHAIVLPEIHPVNTARHVRSHKSPPRPMQSLIKGVKKDWERQPSPSPLGSRVKSESRAGEPGKSLPPAVWALHQIWGSDGLSQREGQESWEGPTTRCRKLKTFCVRVWGELTKILQHSIPHTTSFTHNDQHSIKKYYTMHEKARKHLVKNQQSIDENPGTEQV